MLPARLLLVIAAAGCNGVFGLRDTVLSDSGVVDAYVDLNDEDGDGLNNTVDNCPGITNRDQADGDGDRVGDVCDPRATSPGDRIAIGYFFNNPATDGDAWAGTGWRFEPGHAVQSDAAGTGQLFALAVPDGSSLFVEIGLVVTEWTTAADNAVGIQLDGPGGPSCFFQESSLTDNVMTVSLSVPVENLGALVQAAPVGVPVVLGMGIDRVASRVACKFGATYLDLPISSTPGSFGVFSTRTAAKLNYVVVYTRSE